MARFCLLKFPARVLSPGGLFSSPITPPLLIPFAGSGSPRFGSITGFENGQSPLAVDHQASFFPPPGHHLDTLSIPFRNRLETLNLNLNLMGFRKLVPLPGLGPFRYHVKLLRGEEQDRLAVKVEAIPGPGLGCFSGWPENR